MATLREKKVCAANERDLANEEQKLEQNKKFQSAQNETRWGRYFSANTVKTDCKGSRGGAEREGYMRWCRT